MGKVTPLLIVSDAPTSGSGLGRIAGDLALRIAEKMTDTFRVATLGYGGIVSRHLPYHQYIAEDMKDFVPLTLPEIWEDWAGNEKGIYLTINDLSRLGWLAHPGTQCENPRLRDFLLDNPFQKWGYFPIDASGPNDRLTFPLQQTLLGFDRVLAYGKWAAGVVDRTLDKPEGTTEYLPHGIDSSIFYERNRKLCRKMFVSITGAANLLDNQAARVKEDEVLVGIVATNQSRKDWQLALETCAILANNHKLRVWIKCDVLERHWSIPALLIDYGLVANTLISLGDMSDDSMAQAYSACDVTLAPGLGEGFGLPIFESLFCQTPAIHGDYAGAPEWMLGSVQGHIQRQKDEPLLVKPIAYRYEGVYSCKRPVFSAQDWADKAEGVLDKRMNHNGEIDWGRNRLWLRWEQWLKAGIQ
jgi:glycosyltransferase involved in cell wall biosynthesis